MKKTLINSALFEGISVSSVPGSQDFVVKEKYVINSNIKYFTISFEEFVAQINEPISVPAQDLRIHRLKLECRADLIRDVLGGGAVTDMATVYSLISEQPDGGEGTLLTNGFHNYFFVHDGSGEVCLVNVFWEQSLGGWGFDLLRKLYWLTCWDQSLVFSH